MQLLVLFFLNLFKTSLRIANMSGRQEGNSERWGTRKVPSTVEYVLFPAERHFRRAKSEEETLTDLNETIKRGRARKGRKDRGAQETNKR